MTASPEGTILCEASWEVCNKVGGIHTVLTTKLAHALALFGDDYLAIGPKVAGQETVFHPEPLPDHMGAIADRIRPHGIELHYGTWITPGGPKAVLLDANGLRERLDEYKQQLWDAYKLDTLNATDDVDEPLAWSLAVGHFLDALAEATGRSITFHGHEWLCAGGFLNTKHAAIRSVFTTHATILGRSLSSRGLDIYTDLNAFPPDESAKECNITAKFQLERLCAHQATVFTTVSHITAREATAFLGRTPDVLTENGIDPALFPDFAELSQEHHLRRQEFEDFLAAYFFPSYRFELSQTQIMFTMGRYETHNKGYDLALQAFGRLNEELKQTGGPTVVACFFVPGDAKGPRREVLFQQAVQSRIKETLRHYSEKQQRELYASLWEEGEHCANVRMIQPHTVEELKQLILKLPSHKEVPLSPFELNHPDQDDMTRIAAENGLKNREEDRVKVLFFPAYFDGFDGIFNRSLYQIISGCDLGFFPSLYEPWGYTPMESLIMGIPAITSNLAGFGLAVAERGEPENQGIFLLRRDGVAVEESLSELTKLLASYVKLDRRAQLEHRMRSYLAIRSFSWELLYGRYRESYERAWTNA